MSELTQLLAEDVAEQYDVAAIDEAQFFPDLVHFCRIWTQRLNRRVIVAGLDSDCERQQFGQVLDLVPFAAKVTKLTARCCKTDQKTLLAPMFYPPPSPPPSPPQLTCFVTSTFPLGPRPVSIPGVCNKPATLTHRKSPSKEQILVGGADLYQPVCIEHFNYHLRAVTSSCTDYTDCSNSERTTA